jgi:hypothetical protein
MDLAQLRFVRVLVQHGATIEEAAAVVQREIERFRPGAKTDRRRLTLRGMRLVPVAV